MDSPHPQPFLESLPVDWRVPVLFASPHSGRSYPPQFLRRTGLSEMAIRSTEDAYVDQLFADAPEFGAPLIAARAPRAFVDLNRAPDDLDPLLISGLYGCRPSRRASAGYGVIPRLVGRGRRIHAGKISRAEARERISAYHTPYHARLERLMTECVGRFGEAILFDCHSTPREVLKPSAGAEGNIPGVVLGDRFGKACDPSIVEQAEAVFRFLGITVSRNAPFSGAYISRRYGRPAQNRHVLQIEIDRSLYLDETAVRPGANFHSFCRLVRQAIAGLVLIRGASIPVAAE